MGVKTVRKQKCSLKTRSKDTPASIKTEEPEENDLERKKKGGKVSSRSQRERSISWMKQSTMKSRN